MKAAVIGCGAQGRGGHVANYAKMEEVSLVAVCDVNFERAQAVAQEFNVPHVYADYREMLEKHALDLSVSAHPMRCTGIRQLMPLTLERM